MNALPKRYRWLLLLSLALNIGLVTAVVEHHWHRNERQSSAERRWARIPDSRQLARVLEDADRQILGEVLERHRAQIGRQYRPIGQSRREVAEALRAEPFDPDALTLAFADMRSSEGAMGEAKHAFLLELATRISADGRKRIADRMQRSRRGRESERGRAPETAEPPPEAERKP